MLSFLQVGSNLIVVFDVSTVDIKYVFFNNALPCFKVGLLVQNQGPLLSREVSKSKL